MQFNPRPAPFIHFDARIQRVMLQVLLPAIAVLCYGYGFIVLIQLVLAGVTAVFAELICLMLRKKALKILIFDMSALLTGFLLALSIPNLAQFSSIFYFCVCQYSKSR